MIECKELIVSTLKRRGEGTKSSPIRQITEVYNKDGIKIAEYDPHPETFTQIELIEFAKWVKANNFDVDKLDNSTVEMFRNCL